MSGPAWLGLLRHVLTFVGGLLVAQGVASDADVASLATDIPAVIGAVLTIWGVVASILDKRKAQKSAAQPLAFGIEKQ